MKRYYNYKKAEIKKTKESYLPLARVPGYAQVDFGDFKYYDSAGKSCKGHALIVRRLDASVPVRKSRVSADRAEDNLLFS